MATSAAPASGCASILLRASVPRGSESATVAADPSVPNPAAPYPYYLGTAFDAVCVALPLSPSGDATPHRTTIDRASAGMLAPFCLLDLPLSALVDTALWPIDVAAHGQHERRPSAPSAAPH